MTARTKHLSKYNFSNLTYAVHVENVFHISVVLLQYISPHLQWKALSHTLLFNLEVHKMVFIWAIL